MKKSTLVTLLVTIFNFVITTTSSSQTTCTSNIIYAINSSSVTIGTTTIGAQRGLFVVDPITEAYTLVEGNLFGGGEAAARVTAGSSPQTSAIALDFFSNTIWFCNRGDAGDPYPRIFSYNIATRLYGTTSATFAGLSSSQNLNKSAFNPVDRKIYFHNGSNNHLYRFDPASPSTSAQDLGLLNVTGLGSTIASFSGGDIAFDGLGNLTGAFSNGNILAIFPGNYDANGNYTGLSLTGVQFAPLPFGSPASVAFLSNGNYLVGGTTGTSIVNSNTGIQTDLGDVNFGTSDFASCAAPSPKLVVNKTGMLNCTDNTITYTITIENTGQFHSINTILKDTMPAGITITSATMNGVSLSTTTLGTTGIEIKSPGTNTNGQVLKGESVTIVLQGSFTTDIGSISSQAFVRYNGIESLGLSENQIPSNDPHTPIDNDPTTLLVGCIILPVNLTSFTVSENNCTASLNWHTTSEVSFSHYAVERSTDGVNFTSVGKVKANGTGKYQFADKSDIEAGISFYRLRMVDLNGTYTFSKTVKLQTTCTNTKLSLYPNPAGSTVQIKGLTEDETVRIYTANGRLIIEQRINTKGALTLDISSYTAGVYNVVVQGNNGKNRHVKFLKAAQ